MPNADPRLDVLEREVRRLRRLLLASFGLVAFIVLGNCAISSRADVSSEGTFKKLLTSELVVVDADGTERVRISALIPDAVIGGRLVRRDSDVAGVVLYDANGQERSGYVTERETGNVLLTLDGRERQTALFVADTTGATALRIWGGDDAIDLRSDSDGARISVIRDGSVVFQEPAFASPESTNVCRAFRSNVGALPRDELLAACGQRMSEDDCVRCLPSP